MANSGTTVLSYADTVEKVRDSVATILVEAEREDMVQEDELGEDRDFDLYPRNRDENDEDSSRHSGSGLVLTQGGLIVTNAHVVKGAKAVSVRLREAEQELPATVIGIDSATDIALLQVASRDLQPAVLANSARVRPGDIVLALGSPFGLEQTITLGIVSATGRGTLGIIESGMEDFIQTDAAINPGNSGGPLVDGLGRVVGLNTARYWGSSIGFAVPANLMLKVADDLLEHGRVIRGYLGVRTLETTPKLLQELKLPKKSRGVIISTVEAGQPAAKAGFQSGDLVRAVNGRRVENGARFRLSLAGQQPGASTTFLILRQGKEMPLTAVLADPPELAAVRAQAVAGEQSHEWVPGLHVAEISRDLRLRLHLAPDAEGLIVTKPFEGQGGGITLAEGDLILAINGTSVKTASEAAKKLEELKAAVLLLKIRSGGRERMVAISRKS